jgi:hypothetical protein
MHSIAHTLCAPRAFTCSWTLLVSFLLPQAPRVLYPPCAHCFRQARAFNKPERLTSWSGHTSCTPGAFTHSRSLLASFLLPQAPRVLYRPRACCFCNARAFNEPEWLAVQGHTVYTSCVTPCAFSCYSSISPSSSSRALSAPRSLFSLYQSPVAGVVGYVQSCFVSVSRLNPRSAGRTIWDFAGERLCCHQLFL